jgi:hypothetical protein
MTISKHLSRTQLKGLAKVGDVLVPGDGELPSFSRSGSIEHVDRMLDYMNESDRNGVKALLWLFRFTPKFKISWILALTEKQRRLPEPLAAVCRMINLGLKGVVMTLYYSDLGPQQCILRAIHWDATIIEREEEPQAQAGRTSVKE